MNSSGDTVSDLPLSRLIACCIPAIFAAVLAGCGAFYYITEERQIHDMQDEDASRYVLDIVRANLERRIDGNLDALEHIASSHNDVATDGFDAAIQALSSASIDVKAIAVVVDGTIKRATNSPESPRFEPGELFRDWTAQHGVSYPNGNNPIPKFFVKNNARYLIAETSVGLKENTLIVAVLGLDTILAQTVDVNTEHHAFTIIEENSGAYLLGTPDADLSQAASDAIFAGPNQWVLHSIRTTSLAHQEHSNTHILIVLLLLGVLIVGPSIWACSLFMLNTKAKRTSGLRKQALDDVSTRLDIALAASHIGIAEVNIGTRSVIWDDRTAELFDFTPNSAGNQISTWWGKIHRKDRAQLLADLRAIQAGTPRIQSEFRILLSDQSERHIRSTWSAVVTNSGLRLLSALWDVTSDNRKTEALIHAHRVAVKRNKDLARAKDQVEHMALHDPLTGLANRRYFDDYVSALAPPTDVGKRVIGVLQVDLDSFKQVNDSKGHAAGDKVLSHAARAIDRCTRDGDFVARTGGDEFVVFCQRDISDPDQVDTELENIAKKIIDAVQLPMILMGKIHKPAVSIGIAPVRDTNMSWSAFIGNADAALYQAKELGRNRYALHNGTQSNESFEIIRGSEDIFAGIENRQFIPAYQPQFRASDRSLIGLEALARWRHPIRGVLTPETFMPAAKLLKFEAEIDQQILDRTLADIRKWNDLGLKIPRIAVNISPRRLCDDSLIKSLKAMNIPHGVLSFELLESIFVGDDDAQLIENVEQIKALGIHIEIDDFGTGFASIVSLIRLQPNRLKIDRSLVSPVLESPANRQVLRSIVEMARALDIEVLAEGVENELQARVLRTIGCDSLQGFGLAKPMQPAQMTRYLTELEKKT